MKLADLIHAKKTLIVVGSGGVGKTTTSAAFAVHAARMGKKVLVLTVDPARRLASSLGLEELGNNEVEIDPARFEAAGIPLSGGRLFGMMLDTKSTFDELVRRHAPDRETRERIFANPFYQQASTALAGSQEYMAMEKLYEIREQRDYDLIVLDTPPTPNALDFLDAADRLEDFLTSDATKLMLRTMKAAGKLGLGLLKWNTFVMRRLNKFVGADTFIGVLEFIQAFQEMYSGFKERAARVRRILRSNDVAFVIVTSTDVTAIEEATFFHRQLAANAMPFGAAIVNRVRPSFLPADGLERIRADLDAAVGQAGDALATYTPEKVAHTVEVMAAACKAYETLAEVDRDRLALVRERLGADAQSDVVFPVPLFERDIHDLGSLAAFAERVVGAASA